MKSSEDINKMIVDAVTDLSTKMNAVEDKGVISVLVDYDLLRLVTLIAEFTLMDEDGLIISPDLELSDYLLSLGLNSTDYEDGNDEPETQFFRSTPQIEGAIDLNL